MTPTAINWIRALHVVGIVVWMGTLLTLSRLLGFHVREKNEVQPSFSAYEKRMYKFVAIPGMLLTLGAGLFRMFGGGTDVARSYMKQPWMHGKLTLVFVILILSYVLWRFIADLANNPGLRSKGKYMAVHGTIGLCIVFTIILATVQPFARNVVP